jgi:hypothetical protein
MLIVEGGLLVVSCDLAARAKHRGLVRQSDVTNNQQSTINLQGMTTDSQRA